MKLWSALNCNDTLAAFKYEVFFDRLKFRHSADSRPTMDGVAFTAM